MSEGEQWLQVVRQVVESGPIVQQLSQAVMESDPAAVTPVGLLRTTRFGTRDELRGLLIAAIRTVSEKAKESEAATKAFHAALGRVEGVLVPWLESTSKDLDWNDPLFQHSVLSLVNNTDPEAVRVVYELSHHPDVVRRNASFSLLCSECPTQQLTPHAFYNRLATCVSVITRIAEGLSENISNAVQRAFGPLQSYMMLLYDMLRDQRAAAVVAKIRAQRTGDVPGKVGRRREKKSPRVRLVPCRRLPASLASRDSVFPASSLTGRWARAQAATQAAADCTLTASASFQKQLPEAAGDGPLDPPPTGSLTSFRLATALVGLSCCRAAGAKA